MIRTLTDRRRGRAPRHGARVGAALAGPGYMRPTPHHSALRQRPPAATEPAVSAADTAALAALDNVVAAALRAGAIAERARICAIMTAPGAAANLALAWRLAAAGVTLEAAEQALAISILSSAAPADEGDPARFH